MSDRVNPNERQLYRSMNTYDIAQVLHVREADVWNLVFGKRRAALRQANDIGDRSVPYQHERKEP